MLKILLIFLVLAFSWPVDAAMILGRRGEVSGPENQEFGKTTVGSVVADSTMDRMIELTDVPAGGVPVDYGYFHGCTSDGGSDGTFQMAVFNASNVQVGSCSTVGSIVPGSSLGWNEVTWATPITVFTGYRIAFYPSEMVDYSRDAISAWQGTAACGTAPTTVVSKYPTLTVANYDAHDEDSVGDHSYYVTQSGAGTQDGKSLANAWSVSDFNSSANWSSTESTDDIDPGDTVYFSGTITSRVLPAGDGASGSYITIDGWEGGTSNPVANGENTSCALLNANHGSGAMQVDDKHYLIIQDFRFTSSTTAAYIGLYVAHYEAIASERSSNIIVRRNYFSDMAGKAAYFGWVDDCTFGGASGDGNYTHNGGVYSGFTDQQHLTLYNVTDQIVSHNKMGNDSGYTLDLSQNIMTVHGTDDALIEFNDIFNAQGQGGISIKEGGIGTNSDIIVRFNHLHDLDSVSGGRALSPNADCNGIYIYGNRATGGYAGLWPSKQGQNIYLWSNVVDNNADRALRYDDSTGYDGCQENVYFYNNTVYSNAAAGADNTHTGVFLAESWDCTNGPTYTNNIIANNGPGTNQIWANDSDANTEATFLDNLYYDSSGTANFYWDGGYRTLAVMQSTYSQETGSEIDNPDFSSTSNGIFSLSSTSPAIDAATTIANTPLPTITIQGDDYGPGESGAYYMGFDLALDPNNTDWTTVPPTVAVVDQDSYGSGWERGAYVHVPTATETFYCTQTGAGDNYGGTGVWITEPNSIAHAMSVAQFDNSLNWDTDVQDDGKIGPGDTIYFSGTFSWQALIIPGSGTDANRIILDGYEAGECDAHNTTCSGSAQMQNSYFTALGTPQGLVFRDFAFSGAVSCAGANNPGCSYISIARGSDEDLYKGSFITIENNHFTHGGNSYGAAIALGFVTDWLVKDNYYIGDGLCTEPGEAWHVGSKEDFIGVRPSGARGKVINNHAIDSFHLYYQVISVDRNVNGILDFPVSGSYTRDPEANPTEIEIAYNLFDGWCEEGVSFDDPSGSTSPEPQFPGVEIDDVSSVDTGNNYVYFNNTGGEWTPVTDDRYSGFYLVNTTETASTYGQRALIEDHYQNRFTVSAADISKFSVGDDVVVTMIQDATWIHHNRMVLDQGDQYGWGAVWVEGSWHNGLIENNYIEPLGTGYESTILMQSLHKTFANTQSVTGDYTHLPAVFNVIRYNTVERLQSSSFPKFSYTDWDFSYNNSFVDNILWKTGDDDNHLTISKTYCYYSGNQYDDGTTSGLVSVNANGGGLQTPDPASGTHAAIYAKDSIGPNILSTSTSGTSLTATFTDSITGCSSGDCGFSISDDGGSVSIAHTGGSGATRTFTLGRTLQSGAFLYYDGTGNITDGDGNDMYMWSIVGHDLNTEY